MTKLQTFAAAIIVLGLLSSGLFIAAKMYKNSVRKEVQQELTIKAERAINEINDSVERARTLYRYCLSSGLRYDHANNKCSR